MKTGKTSKKTNNFFITAVLMTAVLASFGNAKAATWTQKADMPTARHFLRTSVADGKIYAISALKPVGLLTKVEAYDLATDTWAAKAAMPTARTLMDTSAVDGKIYVMGGEAFWQGPTLTTVEAYDPVSDTWTKKADMPAPRSHFTTSVVNGKIYAIGGAHSNSGPEVSTVEAYDPATDTWTRKADMPTARALISTCVVNGKIFAIGGQREAAGSSAAAFSAVEVYDPVTDTWTRRSDMPWPRTGHGASVVNGIIYILGGRTIAVSGSSLSTVLKYDPATNLWTVEGDMPVRNAGMGVSTAGGRIYVIGGTPNGNPFIPVLSSVWEFVPTPDVDFNGDEVVDAQDMTLMVDHWHTDAPRYDVAPVPGGDGIVDVQDLILLSEHLFEDYRMVAHWMLDETEGDIAFDNASENDAMVMGDPVWQPDGGRVEGALLFDGTNAYVQTPFVLNPKEGAFSAFVWIKGGVPGQVILSQAEGSNWLGADPVEGTLMTQLTQPEGRFGLPTPALVSDVVVTDGLWHEIGLVWDGSDRILYIDGIEVARDFLSEGMKGQETGLTLGAAEDLAEGSFWSGLIDDVRIYDRAIVP
jgi:N-acetylneuraminic acid mutarotase